MNKIDLFVDQKYKDAQELNYLYYLIFDKNIFDKFFDKITSVFQVEKLKEKYKSFCQKENVILIPKTFEKALNFSEKRYLKNPEKLLKDEKRLNEFFYKIQFQEASLENLDKLIEECLKNKQQMNINILSDNERLLRYKDIAYLADCNIYFHKNNIYQFLKKRLNDLYMLNPKNSDLKKLNVFYTLGTTVISTKSFDLNQNH